MCFYCNCEVITKNNNGEIIRNKEGTEVCVQFGNIDFTLKQKDFIAFIKFIKSLTEQDLLEMTNRWNHKIVIRQKSFMGGYCFYPDEYKQFTELLSEASTYLHLEQEIKKILN